jgi:hypothetical protein
MTMQRMLIIAAAVLATLVVLGFWSTLTGNCIPMQYGSMRCSLTQ